MGRNLNGSALLSFYGVQLGSDTDFFMMEGCTYQSGCTVLIRASGRNGRVLSSDEWDDFVGRAQSCTYWRIRRQFISFRQVNFWFGEI